MPDSVCCPNCWTWSELGRRTTCKRCGAPLLLSDGRSVEETRSVAPSPAPAVMPAIAPAVSRPVPHADAPTYSAPAPPAVAPPATPPVSTPGAPAIMPAVPTPVPPPVAPVAASPVPPAGPPPLAPSGLPELEPQSLVASGWRLPATTPQSPPPPPAGTAPAAAPLPDARPRRHRLRRAIAGVAVVAVVVVAAGGVLAYRFFSGSADSLVSMVPSDAALYVNINLDPPGDQKLAVHDLLSKFPSLGSSATTANIDTWLDQAMTPTGLTFSSDVSPWLGSEISYEASGDIFVPQLSRLTLSTATTPDAVYLLASNDDSKAQTALDKLKNGPAWKSLTWSTDVHGGITVTSSSSADGGAYAIVNHTVVIGSTESAVDAVIDTAQGHHTNLQAATSYTTVTSQLPADRVGIMYVDMASVVSHVAASLSGVPGASTQLDMLKAYRGAGVALSASSDGVSLDGTVDFDPTQMTSDERASMAIAPHVNSSLAFMPATAYGMFATVGLQPTVQSSLAQLAPDGSQLAQGLQQIGLTGTNGLLSHLTGDAGIEVDKGAGGIPAGALLVGTDSTAAAESFITSLVNAVCGQSGMCSAASVTTQVDHGVTISTLPISGVAGVAPSWAVTDGMLVVGSTPAEVSAVIDSHASGKTIATAPGFEAVTSHVSTTNNGMFYLDVPAIVTAVRAAMPASIRTSFDQGPGQYLAHVGGIGMSSHAFADHSTFTVFTGIK